MVSVLAETVNHVDTAPVPVETVDPVGVAVSSRIADDFDRFCLSE